MIDPIRVAIQADQRSTASIKSRITTGTSATSQVTNRFPIGSRICENIVSLPCCRVDLVCPWRLGFWHFPRGLDAT